MSIIRNSARCHACGTEVESKHHYDFKECFCGGVFVDGGRDYIRHGFRDMSTYEDTSITEDDLCQSDANVELAQSPTDVPETSPASPTHVSEGV